MRGASGRRGRATRRGGEKRGFAEAFAAEVAAEIEALVAPGGADEPDFEALEQAVRRSALEAAARAVEGRLNADHSDHVGPTHECACGQAARYIGRRPKTLLSVLGPLTLVRACYHCDACRAGICPRDRALGLEGTSLSPATTRMVGLAAAEGSFAKAHPVRKLRNARGERPGRALGDRQPADKVQPVSHRPPEGRDCGGTGRPATPWPRLSPALDGGVQLLSKDALIIPHVQQLNKRQLAARR